MAAILSQPQCVKQAANELQGFHPPGIAVASSAWLPGQQQVQ